MIPGFLLGAALSTRPGFAGAAEITLMPIMDGISTAETGVPLEVRTDGSKFFVVTLNPGRHFWIIDTDSGEKRKVSVEVPQGLSHFDLHCVERLDKETLVASAGWVEKDLSRNGLVFFSKEGKVARYTGYGVGMWSIAVNPAREIVAASIQEPQDPFSEKPDAPTSYTLGFFDTRGRFMGRQNANSVNRYSSYEEMRRYHRFRKVYFLRDAAVITYPEATPRWPEPAVFTFSGDSIGSRETKKGPPGDLRSGTIPLAPPRVADVPRERFRALNIAPVIQEGRSAFLVVWFAAPGTERDAATPHREEGRIFLSLYHSSGGEPKQTTELASGERIGEITASKDGRAFVVCFRNMSLEWSLAEVSF